MSPENERHQFVRVSPVSAAYEGRCKLCGQVSSSIMEGLEACPVAVAKVCGTRILEKSNENLPQP